MDIAGGDTFINVDRRDIGVPSHLWIVVSDPGRDLSRILIVNVSSCGPDREIDDACNLHQGDHPFIHHRSFVYYGRAQLTSIVDLERALHSDLIRFHDPLSVELLERVRRGAAASRHLKINLKELLREQGLIQ